MAIKEQDKVFYEEAENGDKVINLPVTRVNNVEGIGRSANTAYVVGEVVYVDNNKKVALKCTTAGTTSADELDVSGNNIGDTITDGTVVWQVCNRTSNVTSVNGKTGDVVVDTLPIGAIIPHSGNTVPNGYLTCNGAAVSRTTYADLFAVIGTTYGAGNGSTTFNLPNLNNNSFLEGGDTVGVVKNAGLPNITGSFRTNWYYTKNATANGAFSIDNTDNATIECYEAQYQAKDGFTFDASKSNSIYGNSTTVQPKSVTVKYIIKAFSSITNQGNVDLQNIASDYERVNTEIANTKNSINGISDYIVESYRNGTEWYEVYKSGKVRQGGRFTCVDYQDTSKTFVKAFANNSYTLILSKSDVGYGNYGQAWTGIVSRSTTGFVSKNNGTKNVDWVAEGQGA